ncbi:response regulator [Baaleninema sp.]|uniref:response regulator n=1 Tax=Baaleninema sp. TaxID=3101197 RepID=UPI003D0115AD
MSYSKLFQLNFKQLWHRWTKRHQSGWRPRHLLVYLMLGSLAVGVSLTAWLSYQVVRELLLDHLKQSASTALQEGVNEIDDWFTTQKTYIEAISSTPTARSLDWETIRPYLEQETERLDNFLTLSLVLPDGSFRNQRGQTGNIADRQHFQGAMQGQIQVSKPVIGRASNVPIIAVSAPIWNDPNDPDREPLGTLTGAIGIEQFTKVVNRLNYGPGSYAFAIDAEGEPIAYLESQELAWDGDDADRSQEDIAAVMETQIARQIRHSDHRIDRTQIDGEVVYVAHQPLENWSIVLVIPRENIENQLRSLNILAGVLGFILAAATVLAGQQIQASEQARARAARESLLNGLTSRLHASLDLNKTLPPTLKDLANLLVFDCIAFAWHDRQHQTLQILSQYCQVERPQWAQELRSASSNTDLDVALRQGDAVTLIAEPSGDTIELAPNCYSAFPIPTRLGTPGYLICRHSLPFKLNSDERELMRRVVGQLGIAVNQAHLYAETQRAIASLEREQQQLRQVVTNAPVAMAMFDTDMRYLAFSVKWLSDYNLDGENLLGRHHYEVFPDLSQQRQDDHRNALAGQVISNPELVWERSNGERIYLRSAIHPWYCPEGNIGGIIIVTERIDDLVKARVEAERAAQFKADFLANMSHEIRTPMNGVLGMTSLLSRTPLKQQQREYVQAIQRSAQHLLTLINDILDFSKLEAGEMELEAIDFDLDRLIEDVLDVMATQAEEKGLELATLLDRDVPRHLRGDPARLRQILLNLVGNAIKFTDQGEVVVQAALKAETPACVRIRFAVRDTGIGISKEGQQKLFQSFSQVDTSTTRQYGGTGLGLAIAKQLVQLMDGEIGVESVEGIGSIFWFTVRLELADSIPSSALPMLPLDMSRLRLLVAADNATTCQSVQYLVQSWGMDDITNVQTCDLALDRLQEAAETSRPFNILILDLQLSDIDLEQFLDTINENPVLTKTKVVVMSNIKDQQMAERLLERGAASYFLKPVRASRLFDALIAAIAPEVRDDEELAASQPPKPLSSMDFSGLTLLVVEDHPTNQQVILSQLEELGCHADCASNGQEALERTSQKQYDIVLMDCQMPVLDGYAATRELRRREGNRQHTTVVALTAHAMPADRDKCLAAGMDDYIPKPVDLDVLVKTLERWTGQEPGDDSTPDEMSATADDEGQESQPEKVSAETSEAFSEGFPLDLDRLRKVSRGKVSLQHRLLDAFVRSTQTDLEEFDRALQEGDRQMVIEKAHRLKGAAANVGAQGMSDGAAALEQLARHDKLKDNLDRVGAIVDSLTADLDRIRAFVRSQDNDTP